MIKKYAKWVLEENPQIGMTLFTSDPKTGEPPVEMNPDEVIDFINSCFDKAKVEFFPYLEYYYEYLINTTMAPDSYYTQLGTLYIEKIFKLQPSNHGSPSK